MDSYDSKLTNNMHGLSGCAVLRSFKTTQAISPLAGSFKKTSLGQLLDSQ